MKVNFKKFILSPAGSILFIYCLIFIFFFRPTWALTPIFDGDEYFYLQWLRVFFGIENPSGQPISENFYSAGPAIAWLPAGVFSVLLSKLANLDANQCLWAVVSLYSSFLWAFSLYLIFKITEILGFFTESESQFSKILKATILLLNIPILYYATHRTLMSHTVELCVALLCIFFVLRKNVYPAFLSAAFLAITRYNDAPIILIPAVAFVVINRTRVSGALYGILGATLAYVGWVCFVSGYDGHTFSDLLHDFQFNEIWKFFFAANWGAFWIVPAWVSVLLMGVFRFRKQSAVSQAGLLWMLLGIVHCVLWAGNGGDFGQRYLIGTFAVALLVGSEHFIRLTDAYRSRVWVLLSVSAVWMTTLTVLYKSLPNMGYMNNDHFIRNAVLNLFRADYYYNQFSHTTFGHWTYYGLGIENHVLSERSSLFNEDARVVFFLFSGAVLIYCSLFVLTHILERQKKTPRASGL